MDFPVGDRQSAEAYRKMLAPVFEFNIPDHAHTAPFSAETAVYCLPDLTVSKTRTTAARYTRTARTIAQSGTDEILVVCYTDGHFTYRIGDMQRRVERGEIAIFDLSQEVVIEAPFVENISLAISRRRLESAVPLLDSVHGAVTPATALTKVLIGTAEHVTAVGASMQPVEAGPIADAMIGIVAACLELMSQARPAGGAVAGAVSVAGLKAAIERRLTDPDFGPQSLVDEFGITRSTLYRAFEPLGGVSAYIGERRLRRAFRLMTDPAQKDLRVSKLAYELGFAHASAFSRAFKAKFGLTPNDIRTLAVRPGGQDILFVMSAEALPYLHPIDP
jgi:AraC-like DNA-binding protein